MTTLADVVAVYRGSNGEATRALYARLEQLGPAGAIAVHLLRACKTSERAKRYRGRSYKGAAYDTKNWALDNLAELLGRHAAGAGVTGWGWAVDPAQAVHRFVLYVELPTGQVSFHSATRGAGPDYAGRWDGVRGVAADRIVRWAAGLLQGTPIEAIEGSAIPQARYLCDGERHLICEPYTVDGLHAMAEALGIGAHWFHGGRWPHYDIPQGRHAEITARPDVETVSPREILTRIQRGLAAPGAQTPATPAAQERLL